METPDATGDSVPLSAKLAAWWNGDALPECDGHADATEGPQGAPVELAKWTQQRIKVAQCLWGESFLEPGGAVRARKLLTHVMPNSRQSVLDLTTGLGGTAFTLAQDQGLWMDALEPDEMLANEAMKSASRSGLGGQVPVTHVAPNALDITRNKYHLVYSRERLFAITDKIAILTAAAKSLKDGGNLLITDFMIASPDAADSEAYRAWLTTEPVAPQPWTMALYAKTLQKLGLKISGRQDFTQEYLNDVHAGWNKVTKSLKERDFDRKLCKQLMAEGEVWAGRTQAMNAGVVSYCRIIAKRQL